MRQLQCSGQHATSCLLLPGTCTTAGAALRCALQPAYKAALAGMFGKLMGKRDTDKHSQHDQQYQQAPAAVQARDQPDAMSRMDQVGASVGISAGCVVIY